MGDKMILEISLPKKHDKEEVVFVRKPSKKYQKKIKFKIKK
jgi:hypothetical protein